MQTLEIAIQWSRWAVYAFNVLLIMPFDTYWPVASRACGGANINQLKESALETVSKA